MIDPEKNKNIDTKTRLALIEQSIETFTSQYNTDMAELKASLKLVLENYVTRQEIDARFNRQQDEIDGRVGGINKRLVDYATKEEVHELKEKVETHVLGNSINWGGVFQSVFSSILTTAIVGGILYFNLK
jgi:hypothetical protein